MTQSPLMEIVDGIADAKGIDPEKIDIVLQNYIDVEAIERLAAHDTASWSLSFELPDHNVTITSDGVVFVDGTREAVWA